MKLFYGDGDYKLYHSDMNNILEDIELNSVDSIVTDPPYELNFMGKSWDNQGVAFRKETWKKCFDVLKPGGYLLAFGGSRTFHRIACAIEDAGFEIRDTIMWLYGSGFPKSMNIGLAIDKKNGVESIDTGVSSPNARPNCDKTNTLYESGTVGKEFTIKKAQNKWNGWGTCLKPAFEPIIVARKPFSGSLVDNIIEYDVGGINIDECRVTPTNEKLGRNNHVPTYGGVAPHESTTPGINQSEKEDNGRFPANIILTYDETDREEVCGGLPDTRSGVRNPNGGTILDPNKGWNNNSMIDKTIRGFEDSGSASRYFYCAKASKKDRDDGLNYFQEKSTGYLQGGRKEGSAGSIMKNADGGTRVNPYAGTGAPKKNTHPTVKPVELMQYLVRLVTPNGGTVLDPFNGSGSTGKAVMFENKEKNKEYKYIGVELDENYLKISKARIDYARGTQVMDWSFKPTEKKEETKNGKYQSLW